MEEESSILYVILMALVLPLTETSDETLRALGALVALIGIIGVILISINMLPLGITIPDTAIQFFIWLSVLLLAIVIFFININTVGL